MLLSRLKNLCAKCGRHHGKFATSGTCLAGFRTTTTSIVDTDLLYQVSMLALKVSSVFTQRLEIYGPISLVCKIHWPRTKCVVIVVVWSHKFVLTAHIFRKCKLQWPHSSYGIFCLLPLKHWGSGLASLADGIMLLWHC